MNYCVLYSFLFGFLILAVMAWLVFMYWICFVYGHEPVEAQPVETHAEPPISRWCAEAHQRYAEGHPDEVPCPAQAGDDGEPLF